MSGRIACGSLTDLHFADVSLDIHTVNLAADGTRA